MKDIDKNREKALDIARLAAERSGAAFFVGGYVRDKLMGIADTENKDIDIEVHGLAPKQLEEILDTLGERINIGESFGIYALKGYGIDIAMPRSEKNTGSGHRDLEVSVDPFIGVYKAAKRRDFTVNSIMQDILTGEITDNFGGVEDIKNRVIRHVSDETFADDPLRVLRAAQLAARLDFTVADETIELCRGIDLSALSKERVEGELKKALLKADKPSVFFETLRRADKLSEWFPEVQALIGVPQNHKYHMEGDVWTHTMMVLDAAVKYREKAADPFGLMLAALVHDFGKAVCMQVIDGVTHAHGHEEASVPIAREFLRRIVGEKKLRSYVLSLTLYHMKPNVYARDNASVKASNKLFDSCEAKEDLIYLALADGEGKLPRVDPSRSAAYLADRLEKYRETMAQPYVTGKDLIDNGLVPGEDFSEILAYAHKLRLAGVEKQAALKQTLVYARKAKRQV